MSASCPSYVFTFFFVGGRAGSGYVTVAALAILQPSVGIAGTCHLCGDVWLVHTPVFFFLILKIFHLKVFICVCTSLGLCSKYLYLLSHLAGPSSYVYKSIHILQIF